MNSPFRVAFTVLGVPAPQGSFRAATSRNTGRAFLVQSCKRTMPWRQEVAAVAERAMGGRKLLDGPAALTVHFVLPRPRSHHGRRGLRPSAPKHPTTKPDLSKLVRAIEDALTGTVWVDDSLVVYTMTHKRYDDTAPPGAYVEVEAAP